MADDDAGRPRPQVPVPRWPTTPITDDDGGRLGGPVPVPELLTTPMADDGAAGRAAGVPQVRITEASRWDADEVVALWHHAGLTRPWNDPDADFEQARTSPVSAVLIARAVRPAAGSGDGAVREGNDGPALDVQPDFDDEPEGVLVATAMVGVDGHRGWIYYFATDPRVRGAGHGTSMLAACEEWLAAHGGSKVRLMVRRDNPAASFYTRHGYTEQDVVVLGRRLTGGPDDPHAAAPSSP